MIKNVLTEEITRINNIIHGNKLLTESAIASNIIKDIIIKSIKSVIDDTVSKAINKDFLGSGKTMLINLIKNNTADAVFKQATGSGLGVGEVFKDVLAKTVKSLKEQGIENVDENTIKVQIMNELKNEVTSKEIKKSVKPTIDAAKRKLNNIAKQTADDVVDKPKKTFTDWSKEGSKTKPKPNSLTNEPKPYSLTKKEIIQDFKPNTKPSDLGINPTSEMRSEAQLLETTLTEQSKKTLLDYFKKGGRATYDGIKKLIKIGILDANGKVNRKKLWIWGTVLGVGTLYAIGKWCGDNPDTIEDDNLIDDGGSDSSDSSDSTDNKPTDNKPTDNKPTDNKPTDNKPTDNKPTSGGVTYDTEYDLPGYSAVDLDWNKLKM